MKQNKMCTESHLHFDYARLAWDSGFCFEECKNKSAFDMSILGCVDIERVSRERDIITVEKHIPTILKFRLDEELAKILEPTFVKVFKLAQLGIQYLRFCNKYLDNTVIILKKDLSTANEELSDLQKCVEELQSQNDMLKQKHEDLRETIQTINKSISFKCTDCPKAFSTDEYLQLHVKRRHDHSQSAELQAESEKLQLEIKELKQRLNNTEKIIQTEKKFVPEPNNDIIFEKEESVQEKFEKLQNHIEKELSTLRDEEFYRNIYEKWFEEVQKSQKKIFINQGGGDAVRIRESSTQTAIFAGGDGSPIMSPKINYIESQTSSSIDNKIIKMPDEVKCVEQNDNDEQSRIVSDEIELSSNYTGKEPCETNVETSKMIQNESIVNNLKQSELQFEELQDRLKKEAEVQREKLEQVLDQKLAGSLERLETQMNTFYQKLTDIQLTKQEEHKQNIPIETVFKKPQVPPKIIPRFNQTRYITSSKTTKSASSETESESQSSEDSSKPIIVIKEPPTPKPRTVPIKVIARENKPKIKLHKLKSEPIIVGSKNVSTKTKLNNKPDCVITRDDILNAKATLNRTSKSNQVKEFMEDTEETLDDSEEESERRQIDTRVNRKGSKTSTLTKRSVTSLKNAADDEEVFEGLKAELQEVLHLQLKKLGVAPQWNGLPDKSYNHAQSIVIHQASLAKKNISFYSKIRDNIIKKLDTEVRKLGGHIGDIKKDTSLEIKRHRRTAKKKAVAKTEEKPKTSPRELQPPPVRMDYNITSNESGSEIEIKTVKAQQDNIVETPSKSVLKSHQPNNQWTNKKKVFFNLDSDESLSTKDEIKVLEVGGSSSSILSISLDETKGKNKENKENVKKKDDDTSDWDISDIIT